MGVAWGSPCERCNRNECECPRGYTKADGKACTDINECDLNPDICRGGGTCVNTDGSFTCTCPPGLTLDDTSMISFFFNDSLYKNVVILQELNVWI